MEFYTIEIACRYEIASKMYNTQLLGWVLNTCHKHIKIKFKNSQLVLF